MVWKLEWQMYVCVFFVLSIGHIESIKVVTRSNKNKKVFLYFQLAMLYIHIRAIEASKRRNVRRQSVRATKCPIDEMFGTKCPATKCPITVQNFCQCDSIKAGLVPSTFLILDPH